MKYGLSYTLITRTTGFLARTILHYRKTELDHINGLLKNNEKLKILDYGCNTGYLLDIIHKKHISSNFDLCGADINQYALNYARKKYPHFTFFEINNEFFTQERFDVVILSHVLEHIKDRDGFFTNFKKLMKKEGTLIIAIPQERIRGDCTIIQLLYNYLRLRFENPHVVKLNYEDLDQLLGKNGFCIQEHIYTHFLYPFKSDKLRLDSWSLVVEAKLKDSCPTPLISPHKN